MNLQLLKTELDLSEYLNLSSEAAAAKLNAPTIPYTIEVPTAELTNFLMNTGLYAKLLASYRDHPALQVRVAAEGALDLAQSQIPAVNLQNPTIQQSLAALVQGGVWTQAEADSVLGFARHLRSRSQELVGQNITPQDINAARWLDQTAAFDARIALLTALRDDLASGNSYHELSEVD